MKWLLVGMILLFCSFCFAQTPKLNNIDSLEAKLKSQKIGDARIATERLLFRAYINNDPKKALAAGKMGLHDAEQLANDTDKCIFYDIIAEASNYLDDNTTAMKYLKADNELARKIGFKFQIALSLQDMGKIYQDQSDYVACQTHYFEALTIFEELKNYHYIAICNYNIGATYSNQFDYKKAIFYGERALEASKKSVHKTVVPIAYILLGACMSSLKNYPEAHKYFYNALAIFQKEQDDYSIATALFQLSTTYPGALSQELGLAFKAQKLWDKVAPEDFNSINNLGNIGCMYAEMARQDSNPANRQKLFDNAQRYLLKAIALGKKTNTKTAIIDFSDSLSVINASQQNYKDAYANIITHNKLYDSVFSQNTKNKIASLEGKHEIELRDKQLQINKLEIANEHKQRWFLVAVIGLLFLVAGLVYYQSIQRKKTNTTLLNLNSELDEANKVKIRFFSILNHDLRSPLASFINFLHLQQDAPDLLDEESKEAFSKKARASAENLLITMEDLLLWSKGQMENFKPNMQEVYVSELFGYLKQSLPPVENIAIYYEQQRDIRLMIDEHYLKTIMYNLTNNAIKALRIGGGTIVWKAWEEGEKQYLSVTDNGPGASEEAFKALYDESAPIGISSGLGLHIVRDLAKAIACTISVLAKPGKGVAVVLKFV